MKSKDYLKKELFIPLVDKDDTALGKIERWEAHKKGILHRAFTLRLVYKNNYVLQHRKHIVFDGYFDATLSSHQLWLEEEKRFQTMEEAMYYTLEREWGVLKKDLMDTPKLIEKIYYKAQDKISSLIEHEIDYVYEAEIKALKKPNLDYAYGYVAIPKDKYNDKKFEARSLFAPWIKEENFIKRFY